MQFLPPPLLTMVSELLQFEAYLASPSGGMDDTISHCNPQKRPHTRLNIDAHSPRIRSIHKCVSAARIHQTSGWRTSHSSFEMHSEAQRAHNSSQTTSSNRWNIIHLLCMLTQSNIITRSKQCITARATNTPGCLDSTTTAEVLFVLCACKCCRQANKSPQAGGSKRS